MKRHQALGKQLPNSVEDYFHWAAEGQAEMSKAIREGVFDREAGKPKMAGFADKLSEQEIAALVDYILALPQAEPPG